MTENTNPTGAGVPIRATAMAWFRREDFAQIKALMSDGHKLHKTWEEWTAAAEAGQKHFEATGTVVIRVFIIPDEFAAWCRLRGRDLDAKARIDFAVEVAGKQHGTTH
jgi:hypothetical protein